MPVSAMYPGTFDPITLGHEDLVRRAHIVFRRTAEGDVSDLELLSDGPLPLHRSLGR